MMKTWKKALRVLAPALLLPLWSCGDDKTTVIGGSGGELGNGGSPTTPSVPSPLDVEMAPLQFAIIHTVGKTGCPQKIGSATIRNFDAGMVWFEQVGGVSASKPVSIQPRNGFIDRNGEVRIDFFFDCSTQASFQKTITFKVKDISGREKEFTVTVIVTIQS